MIHWLTQYRDAIGTPITIVFDGGGAPAGTPKTTSSPEFEVLYSKRGQTADQIIERATYRLSAYGEVLVVTDDRAERDTVLSMGGLASNCANFIESVTSTLSELHKDMKRHNRREVSRFKERRI